MSFKHSIFAVIVSVLAVSCLNSSHELHPSNNSRDIRVDNVFYNPDDIRNRNQTGLEIALLHEFMHPYLAMQGKGGNSAEDHQRFVTEDEYLQAIRNLFPNRDQDFYDIAIYVGCVDCEAFLNLDKDEHEYIDRELPKYFDKYGGY